MIRVPIYTPILPHQHPHQNTHAHARTRTHTLDWKSNYFYFCSSLLLLLFWCVSVCVLFTFPLGKHCCIFLLLLRAQAYLIKTLKSTAFLISIKYMKNQV